MRVLIVTSEWPTPERPTQVPFLVQQVEYMRKAGLAVDIFAFRGQKNPLRYLQAWLNLRRQYNLKQFDILHAHFGQCALIALPSPVPLVVTFHGSDLQGIVGTDGRYTLSGRILSWLSRATAPFAAERIVVAEKLANYLPGHLSAHVIPCGLNFERFCPMPQDEARLQVGLPRDKHLVLFAADPHKQVKRHWLAREAIALLQERFEVELVTLSGVEHALVPAYMNACDALVLTSHHEGSPTVVKEALACNLPIVTVDVGDVRQRLDPIEGCIVCADDAPATIAEGLAQVLQHRSRVAGREAVAELDERVIVQKIIEIYRVVRLHHASIRATSSE